MGQDATSFCSEEEAIEYRDTVVPEMTELEPAIFILKEKDDE